jgi:hypothetical protein
MPPVVRMAGGAGPSGSGLMPSLLLSEIRLMTSVAGISASWRACAFAGVFSLGFSTAWCGAWMTTRLRALRTGGSERRWSRCGSSRRQLSGVLLLLPLLLQLRKRRQLRRGRLRSPVLRSAPLVRASAWLRWWRGCGFGGGRRSGRLWTPVSPLSFSRRLYGWPIQTARGGSWMRCLSATWLCASFARTSRSLVIFALVCPRRLATSFVVSLRSRRISSIRLALPHPPVSAVAL